jgi:Spy/CpxP family protein refolding chaperone
MRGLILGAVILMAWAPSAKAQQLCGGGRQAGLFAGITLSETQQKQVDSVRAAHEPLREAMRASRQPGRGHDSAHVQLRTTMQEQVRQSYRAVLTPAQQVVFDSNLARMRQSGPGQGPRHRGGDDAPCGGARAADQPAGGR